MGKDNSADVVLTFRNLHNWAMKGYLEPVFDSAYKVLKSGGTFGIVEHRANPGMDAKTGYMDQAQMIKLAEKAGFTFVESSEINANAKDTKDYPKGVWTLPPRLALDDQDKESISQLVKAIEWRWNSSKIIGDMDKSCEQAKEITIQLPHIKLAAKLWGLQDKPVYS